MIKFRSVLLVALVAGAVGAAPARAQSINDVRCVLVSNAFAKSAKDQNAKRMAEGSLYFYFGRIAGRLNDAQLRSQFLAQQKTLTARNATATMQACFANAQRSVKAAMNVAQQLAPRK